MGRKLDEDDVIRVMHERIVGVSEERAKIVASYVPTAEPSTSDCWKCNCPRMSNDNKTTDESIDTKSSRYDTDRTTDDLISRAKAIDKHMIAVIDGVEVVPVSYLKSLPSAQPEPRWTPVTEGLPKVKGCYLVSVKNEHERRYSKTAWFEKGSWFARQDVIAWMPLPEPYEEVNRNDER